VLWLRLSLFLLEDETFVGDFFNSSRIVGGGGATFFSSGKFEVLVGLSGCPGLGGVKVLDFCDFSAATTFERSGVFERDDSVDVFAVVAVAADDSLSSISAICLGNVPRIRGSLTFLALTRILGFDSCKEMGHNGKMFRNIKIIKI